MRVKLLLAPDSFKGSLRAARAAALMEDAARRVFPEVQCVLAPIADGGEGTVEALSSGCGVRTHWVTGPLGAPVEAMYACLADGRTYVLEMAQASGLLQAGDVRDPLRATSRGTGELIAHAIAEGAQHLLIGLGGSATNDGGMGMLAALGARFWDAAGRLLAGCGEDLEKVCEADLSGLPKAAITVISDVSNPLLGEAGATRIYGPQKGATGKVGERLEKGMAHYARVLSEIVGKDIAAFPGAGAAGGMGAALGGVLGAKLRPGIEAVLDAIGFDALLAGCDLVVTGEGQMDAQSVCYGKAPTGVARRCAKNGVPVIALVGGMGPGAMAYLDEGACSIMTAVNAPMPAERAMRDAEALLFEAAERMFRMVKMGMDIAVGAKGAR